MKTAYFRVAAHTFSVSLPEEHPLWTEMGQYAPFAAEPAEQPAFALEAVITDDLQPSETAVIENSQDDECSVIRSGNLDEMPYFEFILQGQCMACMTTDKAYRKAHVTLAHNLLYGLNNTLMVMYALATANSLTALFHSSVVGYQGHAYLFLGKSGTGKSTHSRLWMQHLQGVELINDDNPVVRVMTDGIRVFGTPWSGKTPCYRAVDFPVGGIVELSQAPYNRIRRLGPIEAYAALIMSISGKRWDKHIAEGLHQTENYLTGHVPVWHLECLPDEAAAQLCSTTIKV